MGRAWSEESLGSHTNDISLDSKSSGRTKDFKEAKDMLLCEHSAKVCLAIVCMLIWKVTSLEAEVMIQRIS